MAYLVGEFYDRDNFSDGVVIKKRLTKEDLSSTTNSVHNQIINMSNGTYWHPIDKRWKKLRKVDK